MPQYKCFLCVGQPVVRLPEGKNAMTEAHNHYMDHHFEEYDGKENRQTNDR